MPNHNKKRNVGLLYEFLVRDISKAIVEKNDSKRDKGLAILTKHYKRGSEIYKEFRLFHSLAATTVESDFVAESILNSAKEASRKYDAKKLDREKSFLIKDINHILNDKNFYNKRFNEYTVYATIQTLLNEGRNDLPDDIVRVAQYEQCLKEWLLCEKDIPTLDVEESADPLVEKLMIKKFNERYKQDLTKEQAEIIKTYIFSSGEDVENKLIEVKDGALGNINEFLNDPKNKSEKYLSEKLKRAKVLIESTTTSDVNDDNVERFLDIAKLSHEIGAGE